jgi:hypothetical protein
MTGNARDVLGIPTATLILLEMLVIDNDVDREPPREESAP